MLKRLESVEGSLLKYGVAALFIIIPLYPKFPLFMIPGTWVAVRLEDFLIFLIFLAWIFYEIRHKFEFLKDDLNKTVLAYFVIGFISFISAVLITHSVVPHIGLLHTVRRVEYMIALFIVVASVKSMKEVVFYLEVIFLTLFLVFLYGIGQKFFFFPVISTMNVEFAKGIALRLHSGARVSSTFSGHYDLAAYLVLLLPLAMAILVGAKQRLHKILMAIIFLVSFWLLLVSASRISFFAYLFGISFTLWFLRKKLWIIPVLAFSILASFSTPQLTERYSQGFRATLIKIKQIKFTLPWEKQPTVISFVPEPTQTPIPALPGKVAPVVKKIREIPQITPTPIEKRIFFYGAGEEISQTEDRSAAIRFKVEWPRALRALFKNPILGTGYSSITLATDNDYLRAMGETGILGFLAFGLILVSIISKAKDYLFAKKSQSFSGILVIGISGALVGFLANAFFIDVFEASKVAITFWLLVGLLVGITKIEKGKQKA